MGARSDIEWTDASWSAIRARNLKTGKIGWHCEHATTGCEFCYAESMNKRLGTGLPFKPGHRKDIEIFLDEKMLLAPLRWKTPRMIFVCSMTDAFADFVTDEWLDKMFAVMALSPQHTFQVLTKRAGQMRHWFADPDRADSVGLAMLTIVDRIPHGHRRVPWPLPNVWLGVSAERQQEFDERAAYLRETPAAVRFISFEPLLGHIEPDLHGIHWAIVGGESGPNARPMHPVWARRIRNVCVERGVPYFFKQWGAWKPCRDFAEAMDLQKRSRAIDVKGNVPGTANDTDSALAEVIAHPDLYTFMSCVGKKAAGRLLDGIEHNGMPVPA